MVVSIPLKKAPSDKPSPSGEVRAWGNGPRSASLSMCDMNVSLPESMSDGFDQWNQNIPDLICISGNTTSQSVSQPSRQEMLHLTMQHFYEFLYMDTLELDDQ